MPLSTRHHASHDVFLLRDGVFEAPPDSVLHTRRAAPAGEERAVPDGLGRTVLQLPVNCFLLRGPTGLTLVDAGCGSAWGEGFGGARAALGRLGVAPEAIDHVLLTHLHSDHVLGLFEGEAAHFPRAEVLVPRTDLAFFTDAAERDRLPPARQGGFALAARLQRLYAGRLQPVGPGPVRPGIEALPLPGHTPGHTGYRLGDLLLWGDALHLAALQPGDPDIGMAFDLDPAGAAATRHALLRRCAAEGWVVAGAHIEGFRRVESAGCAWKLSPA
ncbi:MBL fold metallo-hydrolase [Pseudoroseomonas cervicalis]|uniref:AidB family quorum-quenching N-acyl homoserine lactonase n=1 Tax=Teichococcus cervicalis TaxID=204525 RepID=UPI0022F1C618|nr:MBL fold metallo-hydrolase [Pseudoroseomonas cervicalis]WBV43916.1 MBL fold metallo-hydrolase [Pseudoroseomonas cervicalis]